MRILYIFEQSTSEIGKKGAPKFGKFHYFTVFLQFGSREFVI